jgi:ferredoxin
MADANDKVKGSVPGAWYVDHNCIDCDLCRSIAPEFFDRDEDEGLSVVQVQPTTDKEHQLCEEAREACPVDAIGNDGE